MYATVFKKVLFPFYETVLRGRNTLRYLETLNKSQWQSREQLEEEQWDALKKLLNHAYEQSPYYRELFDKLDIHPNDIKTYEDYRAIPICSREDVVNHNEEMVARNYQDRVSYKTTGGSTGVPVKLGFDRASYEWRTAAAQRGYQWANCEAGQDVLYIWSGDIGQPPLIQRIKNSLYHKIFNRTMFNCYEFGDAEMQRCLEFINSKKPGGIVAFTTAIYNLAKYIDDRNLQCSGVPSIITGAERLLDYQRELIEKVFQTKVFNTYGCREFMLIAAECEKHEGLHLTIDNLYVEILKDGVPAKPGESGDVVVSDLHNFGMPFIRYKNGDIAVQGEKPCSCGRGLPLIESIEGRIVDVITALDGTEVSGTFFPHLMKEIKEVKKYQAIQKSRSHLLVKLVEKEPIPDDRLAFCRNEILGVLGAGVEVEFEIVKDIPLTPSGKYRVTISEIADR